MNCIIYRCIWKCDAHLQISEKTRSLLQNVCGRRDLINVIVPKNCVDRVFYRLLLSINSTLRAPMVQQLTYCCIMPYYYYIIFCPSYIYVRESNDWYYACWSYYFIFHELLCWPICVISLPLSHVYIGQSEVTIGAESPDLWTTNNWPLWLLNFLEERCVSWEFLISYYPICFDLFIRILIPQK